MTSKTASNAITQLVSEYKGDFIPSMYEDYATDVLANSDNDVIDTDVVYNLLVDGAVRSENEKTVIQACLKWDIGHKFLADAATRLAHNTQDWSGDLVKGLRAKIYKYSKELNEDKIWTIKKCGGKKNPHFEIVAPTTRAPKPETAGTNESTDESVKESKPSTPSISDWLSVGIKEFGYKAIMEAMTSRAQAEGTVKAVMTMPKKPKQSLRSTPVNGH